jgi:hypothetical protein
MQYNNLHKYFMAKYIENDIMAKYIANDINLKEKLQNLKIYNYCRLKFKLYYTWYYFYSWSLYYIIINKTKIK